MLAPIIITRFTFTALRQMSVQANGYRFDKRAIIIGIWSGRRNRLARLPPHIFGVAAICRVADRTDPLHKEILALALRALEARQQRGTQAASPGCGSVTAAL